VIAGTHTAAGIGIAGLSAILTGTGTVVEKIALQKLPDIHARRFWVMIRTLCASSQWLWGCALLLGGLVCQGLALSLAPISVAQPIFASGIVLLLVLSHFVLHDRLRPIEWFALGVIVVALVLLGLSIDSRVDHAGGPANLTDLLLAAIPTAAVGLGVFAVADRAHGAGKRLRQLRAPLFGMAAGLLYGVAGLGLKSAATFVQGYGLVGSVPHLVVSPDLYLLAVAMATGLVLFQTGLQRCAASVVSPVNIVTSTTYVIAVGTVLFNEHLPSSPGPLGLRIAGFVGVVAGLVTLAAAGEKVQVSKGAPLEEALGPLAPTGSVQVQPVDVRVANHEASPLVQPVGGLSRRARGQIDVASTAAAGESDDFVEQGGADSMAPGGLVDHDVFDDSVHSGGDPVDQ
jgi:drug/metabolite transporter (DMT)-like permease